jgi:hypothetical protein
MEIERAVFCAGTYSNELILTSRRVIVQKLPPSRRIAHIVLFPLAMLGGYSGCFSMEITANDGKREIKNEGFFGPPKNIDKVIVAERITKSIDYDEITQVKVGRSSGIFELLIESKDHQLPIVLENERTSLLFYYLFPFVKNKIIYLSPEIEKDIVKSSKINID